MRYSIDASTGSLSNPLANYDFDAFLINNRSQPDVSLIEQNLPDACAKSATASHIAGVGLVFSPFEDSVSQNDNNYNAILSASLSEDNTSCLIESSTHRSLLE